MTEVIGGAQDAGSGEVGLVQDGSAGEGRERSEDEKEKEKAMGRQGSSAELTGVDHRQRLRRATGWTENGGNRRATKLAVPTRKTGGAGRALLRCTRRRNSGPGRASDGP